MYFEVGMSESSFFVQDLLVLLFLHKISCTTFLTHLVAFSEAISCRGSFSSSSGKSPNGFRASVCFKGGLRLRFTFSGRSEILGSIRPWLGHYLGNT